jgi:hypothetical protein
MSTLGHFKKEFLSLCLAGVSVTLTGKGVSSSSSDSHVPLKDAFKKGMSL